MVANPVLMEGINKVSTEVQADGYIKGETSPDKKSQGSADSLGDLIQAMKESFIFVMIQNTLTTFFPWLCSVDSLNHGLQLVMTNLKERPATSILYGLVAVFGFIPFLGFVLVTCGSFALFFTGFVFCQSVTVMITALVCAGLFCGMVCAFAMLALLLGGALNTFKIWGILARYASKLFFRVSIIMLKQLGVPEADLPPPAD